MGLRLNLAYRLFVIAVPIWAVVTYAWSAAAISMPATTVAGGWFAAAIYGLGLAVALFANRDEAFSIRENRSQLRELDSNVFTGAPLNAYIAALAVWAVVSLGWWAGIGQGAVSATVIGYGWYAVAAFGGVTVLGMTATNLDLVLEAANLTPSSTDRRQ